MKYRAPAEAAAFYGDILRACADAWNWFVADPDRIRSIGTAEWATVNV